MPFTRNTFARLFWNLLLIWLVGCQPVSLATRSEAEQLQAIATTTLIGDVLSQVAGDQLQITVLLPVGSDPHGYQPTPKDIARLVEAEIVFMNGLGLEPFAATLRENLPATTPLVIVSEGIPPLQGEDDHADEGSAGETEHTAEEGLNFDPHVWMDPNNVSIWVDNIEKALISLDPQHADIYRLNARAYRQQLDELDAWIRSQVEQIPPENRELVTDHTTFAYFAERYGFRQVGQVIPGASTLAEPSARQLAELEQSIRVLGVPAIFVGDTVNSALAQRIAADTGIQVVILHTGSLTGPEGTAPTYLDFIRYNVEAIVNALN
jgi:ABC-type Zn uptake system ZnuABC Zn-binding protein ZnuA